MEATGARSPARLDHLDSRGIVAQLYVAMQNLCSAGLEPCHRESVQRREESDLKVTSQVQIGENVALFH